MKQATVVNLMVTAYVTAMFIFFQPMIFPFDLGNILGNTMSGDAYYMSMVLRFCIFLGISIITMPFVYYLVDHYPHHPEP